MTGTCPSARTRRTAIALIGVVAAMVALTAASVPLYRLYCRLTGYQGTPQVATQAPERALDRLVTVRFNADIARDLPWTFVAPQPMTIRVGERALAYFKARNEGPAPATGTAVFNVTPDKAGLYFDKIACFCFDAQTLGPGEEAELPVSFFVDPAIAGDRDAQDIKTITLSYTFYRTPGRDQARGAQAGRPAPAPAVN